MLDHDLGADLGRGRARRGWRWLGLAALGDLAYGAAVMGALVLGLLAFARPPLEAAVDLPLRLLAPLSLAVPALELPRLLAIR